LHAGNHRLGDFAGLRYLADWQVVLQNMASTGAQSKIETSKSVQRGISCEFGKLGTFGKGSVTETPPSLESSDLQKSNSRIQGHPGQAKS